MVASYLEYPVVIVGAGPTGLLLANFLGQAGIKTLLIDRNKMVSSHPKAILLDDEGFRSLQAVGVAHKVQKNCVMGYGARYYSEKGECFVKISSWTGEYGYPRRNSFLQPDLEQVLVDGLKNWSSVTFMRGVELKDFNQSSSEVHSFLTSSESEIEVKSKLILGCDGGKSRVREILKISLEGFASECDWLVIDTENDPDSDRFTKFICDYKRPAVSIPAPNGGRRYEFMLTKEDNREEILKLSNLQKILAPFRETIEAKDLIRSAIYRFSACVAKEFMKGRALLLGDSCHMTPPFAGQGMNAGLRDVHNLSWKVERYIKGLSSLNLLKSYKEERHKKVKEMIEFAVSLGEIVMPKSELDSKVMSTLWKLTNLIPEAKEYVEKMKFKPKPHCHKGAFLFSNQLSSLKSSVGKMLPQPFVLLSNNKKVLLDEVLGHSFSLIGFGLSTLSAMENLSHSSFETRGLKKVLVLSQEENAPDFVSEEVSLVLLEENVFQDNAYEILHRKNFLYLVRPDRYIFLESTVEEMFHQFESIAKIL